MRIVLLCLIITLTGCAAMSAFNPFKKPGVELNANVGKNVEQDKSQIKVEQGGTKQTADTISNDQTYTAEVVNQVSERVPLAYILAIIFLAGWAIPSMSDTVKCIRKLIADALTSLVVTPVKGIANFILSLLGRPPL